MGGAGRTHLPEAFAPFCGGILPYTARSHFLAGVALDYSHLPTKSLTPKDFNLYLPNNFDSKSWGLTAAMQLKSFKDAAAVLTRPANAA